MAKSRMQIMREERIAHLNELKALGIMGYPAHTNKQIDNVAVIKSYEEFEGKSVFLTGRLVSLRQHGKLSFGDLEDQSGVIQIYFRHDTLGQTDPLHQTIGYNHLRLIDIGDFIEVEGEIGKTKSGEISIIPTRLRLLTKSIRPLPNSAEVPADKEFIFRRRYVDLAINKSQRELFLRKAAFWKSHRDFFAQKGFVEMETPVLEHVTGGADARPFTTHMNALDQEFFLRISTELYQKRLVGGGFEKVFVLGPNFRNEGLSDEHLPEFTQMEWYWAYSNFRDNMELTKELFRYVANTVYGRTKFSTRGHEFDLASDWEEISYPQILSQKFGVDIFSTPDNEIERIVRDQKIDLDGAVYRNRLIDNLWKLIRKEISGPAFLIDEPTFMSPLSKSRPDNPKLTERYHVIIAGSEMANGYSELNDPFEQLDRFREQQLQRDAGDDEAQMLDIDFVEMLEYGMPPTSGHGHSERLFWFLEDITAREGTLFPTLKHKIEPLSQEIYSLSNSLSKKVNKTANKSNHRHQDIIMPDRTRAEAILDEYIKNHNLIKHCRMVAVAMEAYAIKLGENQELWYQTGLLHDLDWEQFPDEHPKRAIGEILKDYPNQMLQAIAAHAPLRTGVEPESTLDKYLYACDELSGFLNAYALMRPEGFVCMKASSVMKKLKDKSFAANVNRDDIAKGFELIGGEPSEHVGFLIEVFEKMGDK